MHNLSNKDNVKEGVFGSVSTYPSVATLRPLFIPCRFNSA
jgi:hypothetical protein